MGNNLIMVSSITHAIRGRDLLKQKGFKASIQKTPGGLDTVGCGYSIFIDKDIDSAQKIVSTAGIKILGIAKRQ